MGRLFTEHMGGKVVITCRCKTPLTNTKQLLSPSFVGSTGAASLYDKVVNVYFGNVQSRSMLTGWHRVCDVFCISCHQKLGWSYEFAIDESQQYKEGKVILENALVEKYLGFDDDEGNNEDYDSERAGVLAAYNDLEIISIDNDYDNETSGAGSTTSMHERLSFV